MIVKPAGIRPSFQVMRRLEPALRPGGELDLLGEPQEHDGRCADGRPSRTPSVIADEQVAPDRVSRNVPGRFSATEDREVPSCASPAEERADAPRRRS